MSVPIWLTSGVSPPPIAVCSFATAWPQSTGVTLTLTSGLAAMNLSAITPSLVPSLPIAQTVTSPLTAAGEPAGAPEAPASVAPGAVVESGAAEPPPSLVPQALIASTSVEISAKTRHDMRDVSIDGSSAHTGWGSGPGDDVAPA